MSLPFYHIGGFSILTRSLYGKNPIIIPDTLKTEDLFSAANKFKPQFLSLVGAQLKKLIETGYKPGNEVKNILIGGGFTDEKLVTDTLNRGWKISKVYGSTETAAFVTAVTGNELKIYPASAGKELVKDSVYILDDEGNQLPAGSEGEIGLKNIPLMREYYRDEEGTKSRYLNGYFLTKDKGYINNNGYLFVLMRRSDLIITGGENVNPHEVQSAIMSIDGIEDVYVFGAEDEKWGQKVSAVVKTRVNYSDQIIKEILFGKLAGYKIPKDIFFTDEIPRNEMGKIDFRKLKLWS
jgi:o-succinylbenzoate---CoA ligase